MNALVSRARQRRGQRRGPGRAHVGAVAKALRDALQDVGDRCTRPLGHPPRRGHRAQVRTVAGVPTAPPDTPVYNPAFDVTPGALLAAVVTEAATFRDGVWTVEATTPVTSGAAR